MRTNTDYGMFSKETGEYTLFVTDTTLVPADTYVIEIYTGQIDPNTGQPAASVQRTIVVSEAPNLCSDGYVITPT